jgi:hypothetical protein
MSHPTAEYLISTNQLFGPDYMIVLHEQDESGRIQTVIYETTPEIRASMRANMARQASEQRPEGA